MVDEDHQWRSDPRKWQACQRLEILGAAIGPIYEGTVHIELMRHRDGTPIEDAELRGIVDDVNALGNVTTLDLSETLNTDHGAKELARLHTVENLYLGSTKVTDQALSFLRALPKLKGLVLSGTAVTDDGILLLSSLKSLEFLQLFATSVTKRAVSALEEQIQGLQVER